MAKTILITGASSGIGRAAAEYFHKNQWNVAATMRNPEKETVMSTWEHTRLYKLDVTDVDSIHAAVQAAASDFGSIDTVLNNAGYGAVGLFEASTPEQIKRQFETNLFGLMNVISSVLPHFRQNKSGIIINISSVGGRMTLPLYSLYHGTKWAVEGFSESLHFELRPLGIKVKIVEPGRIKTDFSSRSAEFINDENLQEYQTYLQTVRNNLQRSGNGGVSPDTVAGAIFKAATDGSNRLRYAVGDPAPWLLPLRKWLPESWFFGLIRSNTEKGYK